MKRKIIIILAIVSVLTSCSNIDSKTPITAVVSEVESDPLAPELDSSAYYSQLIIEADTVMIHFERKTAINFGLYLDSISISQSKYTTHSKVLEVFDYSEHLVVHCVYSYKSYTPIHKKSIMISAMQTSTEDKLELFNLNVGGGAIKPMSREPIVFNTSFKLHFRKLNQKVVNEVSFGTLLDTTSQNWHRRVD